MKNLNLSFNNSLYGLGMFLSNLFCIFLSLSFHEFSHAYIAYKLGDNTAKEEGRLTLNPFKHIDALGAFCLFVFGFGWAKSVPINTNKFGKNYKRNLAVAAFAGPLSNLILALISILILKILNSFTTFSGGISFLKNLDTIQNLTIRTRMILKDLIFTNISIAVFNFIPLPPLDGSKMLNIFIPEKIYNKFLFLENYGYLILFFLLEFTSLKVSLNKIVIYIYKNFEKIINTLFFLK
ncbi:MAG: site-2 protease family protein [Clostridiales bacterium]|jgi:Zn-dependent protease|nr:site-2 protease family protein [Clostridiales bacterium]